MSKRQVRVDHTRGIQLTTTIVNEFQLQLRYVTRCNGAGLALADLGDKNWHQERHKEMRLHVLSVFFFNARELEAFRLTVGEVSMVV